jgi:hypothetical protein
MRALLQQTASKPHEGYLEPDLRYRRGYLEALRDELAAFHRTMVPPPPEPAASIPSSVSAGTKSP